MGKISGDWREEGAMTDMAQKGNPWNLAPPSFHLAVVADTPPKTTPQLQRPLGPPPSSNSTRNVLTAIQIPAALLRNQNAVLDSLQKAHPDLVVLYHRR